MSLRCECDDESIPKDSVLFTWGPRFFVAGSLGVITTIHASIGKAGFVDVHEKTKKMADWTLATG